MVLQQNRMNFTIFTVVIKDVTLFHSESSEYLFLLLLKSVVNWNPWRWVSASATPVTKRAVKPVTWKMMNQKEKRESNLNAQTTFMISMTHGWWNQSMISSVTWTADIPRTADGSWTSQISCDFSPGDLETVGFGFGHDLSDFPIRAGLDALPPGTGVLCLFTDLWMLAHEPHWDWGVICGHQHMDHIENKELYVDVKTLTTLRLKSYRWTLTHRPQRDCEGIYVDVNTWTRLRLVSYTWKLTHGSHWDRWVICGCYHMDHVETGELYACGC